jgi:hypothetical protein
MLGLALVSTWGHSDVRVDRLVAAFIDPSHDPRIKVASAPESTPRGTLVALSVATVPNAPRAPASAHAPMAAAPERTPAAWPTTIPPVALENPKPNPVPARTKPSGKPSQNKGAPKQSLQKTRGASAAEDLARRQLLQSAL